MLWAQAAVAGLVSPLPESDYSVRAVCAAPLAGGARCLALELVPRTAAARARTHPLGMTLSAPIRAGKASEGADGLRPADLHSAYSLPTTTSSVQTIALVDAYNDPDAESDLQIYDEEFGLPACTAANGCFTKVNQEGKSSPLPKEEGGWSLEMSLDIEVAHAVCQNCHILLVEAKTASYANLEAAEDAAAAAGATEISNSWGGEEPKAESAAFVHPGTVITAAAGDDGYLDWYAKGKPFVDYPAASPHVVAVGGTHLELNSPSNRWKSETVWNGYGATGGGCSEHFEAAIWQRELPNWSAVGCGSARAVSDVSADADPYTGVAVYDTVPYEREVLGWLPVGGTSLATPLIASVFALDGGANGVEYPAKTLYENETKLPGSLHNIQTGSNGKCTKGFDEETGLSDCTAAEEAASCSGKAICLAGPGYNGPTGVGTPYGTRALEPARAKSPTVLTEATSSLTATSATLNATVDPNGASVSECKFEYGTSASYGSSVPCASLPGSGEAPVAVSASVTGLAANTEYHYRISATNPTGTNSGSDDTFKTPSDNQPTAVTEAASAITQTTATLNATVNPNGANVSECKFEYGTSSSYGSSVPCASLPGSGSSPVAVSAGISGLAANTEYHYRVAATNTGGTSKGTEQTLATPPYPPTVTGVKPDAGPQGGGTAVTITGTNLATATEVKFGGTGVLAICSERECMVTAPAGTGTVSVTVTTAGGTSNAEQFIYVPAGPPPKVTALSVTSGPATGGTLVTITGTGFTGVTAVKFGPNEAIINSSSETSITVESPAGSGTVYVTVTTPNGTSAARGKAAKDAKFKYKKPKK